MKTVQYNKHSFNADHISSLTVEDFIAQNKGNHFGTNSEADEEAQLREVHELCTKAVNEPETEEAAASEEPKQKGKKKKG